MFDDIESKLKKEKFRQNKNEASKVPKKLSLNSENFVAEHVDKVKDKIKNENGASAAARDDGDNFDQRMRSLHKKGRRRGKRYSVIGISVSVIIFIGVVSVGYYLLSEINSLSNELDERKGLILEANIDRDNICRMDYCCLASLKRIIKNDYKRYDKEDGCATGYSAKKLECENSLKWCEPKKMIKGTIESTITKNSIIDSDNDQLTDEDELRYGTDPNNPDTDGDGYMDGEEVRHGFDPLANQNI